MAVEAFANNAVDTTLTADITSGATTMTLTSVVGWPATGQWRALLKDATKAEVVLCTPNSGATFNIQRAVEAVVGPDLTVYSTAQAFTAASTTVHHIVTAGAVNTKVSKTGDTMTGSLTIAGPQPWCDTQALDFAAQTPSGSLTAATPATVTLSPVPPGVNGTDANHWLYVSGGTGTAEAILITGGTAVAGASSGTITFTPANTHTGAWTIRSATAGMQEAVQHLEGLGAHGLVKVPAGVFQVYAPTRITKHIEIVGSGQEVTQINNNNPTANCFDLVLVNSVGTFRSARLADLTISAGGTSNTAVDGSTGVGLYVTGANQGCLAERVQIKNHATGVQFHNCWSPRLLNFTIFYIRDYGIRLSATSDTNSNDTIIDNGVIANTGATGTPSATGAGVFYERGGSVYAKNLDILQFADGVLIKPIAGANASYGFFTDVLGDTCTNHAIHLDGSAGNIISTGFNGCWGAYSTNGSGLRIEGANVDSVSWIGGRLRENGQYGAHISGGTNIRIVGTEVANNSKLANNTYSGIFATGTVGGLSVVGCRIGNFASGSLNDQDYGVEIAAGVTNYALVANNISDNVTSALSDAIGTGVIWGNFPTSIVSRQWSQVDMVGIFNLFNNPLQIWQQSADALGPQLTLIKNRGGASAAVNDAYATVLLRAKNSASSDVDVTTLAGTLTNVTSGAETGEFVLGHRVSGVLADRLKIDRLGRVWANQMREWRIQQNSGLATLATVGNTSPTITSAVAATAQQNTRGDWLRLSATANNAVASVLWASFNHARLDWAPIFESSVEVTGLSNERIHVGLYSATPSGADSLATLSALGFRFSTGAADANWQCVSANGAAQTVTNSTVAVAANTRYTLRIDATDAANIKFYINGVLVATSTATLPATTTPLGVGLTLTSLSASGQKDLELDYAKLLTV